MFQKLNTNGNSTKSNMNLVSNSKMLKASYNTRLYGVTLDDLKKILPFSLNF